MVSYANLLRIWIYGAYIAMFGGSLVVCLLVPDRNSDSGHWLLMLWILIVPVILCSQRRRLRYYQLKDRRHRRDLRESHP